MRGLVLSILLTVVVTVTGVLAVQALYRPDAPGLPPAPPGAPLVDSSAGEAPPDTWLSAVAGTEQPGATTSDAQGAPEAGAPPSAARAVQRLEAPAEGAYVGAYAPDLLEEGGIEEWNNRTGVDLAIAHWYQGWGDELRDLYPGWLDRAHSAGAVPMISWEPWAKPPGEFAAPDQPDFNLERIADGAYDDYIQRWAEVAAADGRPLLLRFAHEMNGFWYPWSVRENDNTPEDYIRAWRHVHDIFTEAGAENVSWVWAVNTLEGLPEEYAALDFADFYPGDDYVDWVSFVAFNYGRSTEWGLWREPDTLFADTYDRLADFGKPIMLSEVGTVGNGGDPAAWVANALTVIQEDYGNIRAVVWFDAPRSEGIDFRLTDSALSAFREHVASDHWQVRPLATEQADGDGERVRFPRSGDI